MSFRARVALAHLGVPDERLSTVVDALHRQCSRVRVVLRDVLEDVFGATAMLPRSRLTSPRPDAPRRLFIRDDSPGIRIRESAFHHDVKGELADDLLRGAVLGLVLDQAGKLFLRRRHVTTLILFAPNVGSFGYGGYRIVLGREGDSHATVPPAQR